MKNDSNRVAVFIDGSNLYFKLKSLSLQNLVMFNYRGLVDWLVRDRKLVHLRYYIGVVRAHTEDKYAQKMRADQVRLFNHLMSREQCFTIQKGYLMKNDGVYHEKGVDVQIAVDLVVGAYDNTYDVAIVLSSDTDLIPAIRKVKDRGKRVEYIGFAHEPSFAPQKHATLSRLLINEEVQPFVFQQLL